MKRETILKTILIVLIVVLLTLVSFAGIYVEKYNAYNNILPEYLLGMDLEGSRLIRLSVDTSTEEVTYNAEGNVVVDTDDDEDEENTEGYTTVEEPVNPEEVLTEENYLKVKKILEKRLDTLGVYQYIVKLDKATGEIVIELEEGSTTDLAVSYLAYTGSLEIADAETGEILLDNSHIKSGSVVYGSSTSRYNCICKC